MAITNAGRLGGAPEPTGEPWREPSQIDSDRVFYAPEFRRLSGVTQVVPPQDGYLFHDRLSHSLKVAQVAATLARRLIHTHSPKVVPEGTTITDWINPDHCYVAGLAHDIGHPPFGHAGEHTLQALMTESAPPEATPQLVQAHETLEARSFEGNAQSTRIVATLSFRKEVDDPGLGLTLRSLAAIAKYPWLRNQHPYRIQKLAKKWSFYPEEAGVLDALVKNEFIHVEHEPDSDLVLRVHRWPEAEIMDWADDITYAVHDLEDFFRAGRTPLHRIRTALGDPAEADAIDWSTTNFEFISDDEARGCLQHISEKLKKILDDEGDSLSPHIPAMWKTIHSSLSSSFPQAPFSGSRTSHAALQKFASALIVYLSESTTLQRVPGLERVRVHVDPVARLVAEFFKALNSYYVIESASLAVMQYGQAQDLRRLFDSLVAMCGKWLQDVAGQPYPSAHRHLPARLREYLIRALEDTEARNIEDSVESEQSADDGDHSESADVAGASVDANASEDGDASQQSGDPLARDEVAIAVVDYICSLRDAQAAILTSQLHQSPDPAQMHVSWLNG